MKRNLLLYLCFTLCATLSCEKEMFVLDNKQQEIIHMTKASAPEDYHVSMEMAEMFVSSFFEDEWKLSPIWTKTDGHSVHVKLFPFPALIINVLALVNVKL